MRSAPSPLHIGGTRQRISLTLPRFRVFPESPSENAPVGVLSHRRPRDRFPNSLHLGGCVGFQTQTTCPQLESRDCPSLPIVRRVLFVKPAMGFKEREGPSGRRSQIDGAGPVVTTISQ